MKKRFLLLYKWYAQTTLIFYILQRCYLETPLMRPVIQARACFATARRKPVVALRLLFISTGCATREHQQQEESVREHQSRQQLLKYWRKAIRWDKYESLATSQSEKKRKKNTAKLVRRVILGQKTVKSNLIKKITINKSMTCVLITRPKRPLWPQEEDKTRTLGKMWWVDHWTMILSSGICCQYFFVAKAQRRNW